MAVLSFGSDAKKTGLTLLVLLASCFSLAPPWTYANSDLSASAKAPTKSGSKESASNSTSSASAAKPNSNAAANTTNADKSSATAAAGSKDVVRLTKTVKPSHYDLTFEPDLEKFTYTGDETISLSVAEPTNVITLNALEMTLSSVELEAITGGKKLSGKVEMDAANE
ncbi:MAG: hypothetical protein K2X81_09535, partial [Candidatus Obscuribacterales bacterium]|nr:hypothetical protein [Candidatus Obscuribacterales bacterium]